MKFILSISLVMLLTACQHSQQLSIKPDELLNDALFQTPVKAIESPEQIFQLPDQVRAEMRSLVRPDNSMRMKTDLLLNYLFSKKGTNLLYQNDATLTATETLAAQHANCLSLTILSYSLAQELGLHVEFRDIKIPEYWTQYNGRSMLNGHVNLKVVGGQRIGKNGNIDFTLFNYVIDFDIENNKEHFPSSALTKQQIVGMFYNNKAAEAMVSGDPDLAYAYLKAAVQMDPQAAESWNNLAVLYRNTQQFASAERAYLLAIRLAPEQLNPKANLALLYQAMGRLDEAKILTKQVERKRNQNPFYHIMLGYESLNAGQTAAAIEHYRKGLSLDRQSSEAWFGLARAHLLLGASQKAEQYLRQAEQSAPSRRERERYQHKLSVLTSSVQY